MSTQEAEGQTRLAADLAESREVLIEAIDGRIAGYAFDVVDALEARLEARGSTVDAGYLVEIGVARLEIAEVDGALRRGTRGTTDVRRTFGRLDDLLRRIEGAIVKGASHAHHVASIAFVSPHARHAVHVAALVVIHAQQ
jgi:hypothetical protein